LSKFNLEKYDFLSHVTPKVCHFLTTHRYRITVLYRTTMYSSYLPVAFALILCGFPLEKKNESDADYLKTALDILLPLGEYSQIQNDYLDYAGTPERIDKFGSDIMNNKCSWCINTALALANPAQRAILDANYGCRDAEAEERVKQVFREVGLDAYYAQYEVEAYTRINALIDAVPEVKSPCGEPVLVRALFRTFLEKICKHPKSVCSRGRTLAIRRHVSYPFPHLPLLYFTFVCFAFAFAFLSLSPLAPPLFRVFARMR